MCAVFESLNLLWAATATCCEIWQFPCAPVQWATTNAQSECKLVAESGRDPFNERRCNINNNSNSNVARIRSARLSSCSQRKHASAQIEFACARPQRTTIGYHLSQEPILFVRRQLNIQSQLVRLARLSSAQHPLAIVRSWPLANIMNWRKTGRPQRQTTRGDSR